MCVIIIRIMKNLITYLLLVLLSATVASAQQSGVQPAFRNGEVLTLKVSYRAKLIPNTEVATVVMSVADTTINGHPYYCIYANARTMPSWRWFYNLNDTYRHHHVPPRTLHLADPREWLSRVVAFRVRLG